MYYLSDLNNKVFGSVDEKRLFLKSPNLKNEKYTPSMESNVVVTISEEGRNCIKGGTLRKSQEFEDVLLYDLDKTNFTEFEHYMNMREMRGKIVTQMGGAEKIQLEDYMKATMDVYEQYYNSIIK